MITVQRFLDHYSAALEGGGAGLFVGAGLSRPAGFVDWRGLLTDIASDLGLDIAQESDLIAIAQYHVNTERSRARIDRLIIDEFTRDATPTRAHDLIARLPLRTVWTTNYDTLLEDAFRSVGKRADIKKVPENIPLSLPRRDLVLYKMHGDVSDPSRAVLTKEDYETYAGTRQVFVTTLQADLLAKTFLFLGFSFTDPNLEYVLARIRGLLGEHQREHYCLMKAPERPMAAGADLAAYEYERRKFDLRVADLQRYSIRTVLIQHYSEVDDILGALMRRVRRRTVFVSGSASDYTEYPEGTLTELARQLGEALITSEYRLITGLGLGIGAAVLVGAMHPLYRADGNATLTEDRLSVRPFPLSIADRAERRRIWTAHRRNMLSEAGFAIFIAGNRISETDGGVEVSPGVREEFEIARDNDVIPIPIGATGSAARQIWEEVRDDTRRYYGDIDVSDELNTLGDPDAGIDALRAAVLELMRKVR